jgi:hypothetical protein
MSRSLVHTTVAAIAVLAIAATAGDGRPGYPAPRILPTDCLLDWQPPSFDPG